MTIRKRRAPLADRVSAALKDMRPFLWPTSSSPAAEAAKRAEFVGWAHHLEQSDPAAYKVLASLLGTMAEQARLIVEDRARAEARP